MIETIFIGNHIGLILLRVATYRHNDVLMLGPVYWTVCQLPLLDQEPRMHSHSRETTRNCNKNQSQFEYFIVISRYLDKM